MHLSKFFSLFDVSTEKKVMQHNNPAMVHPSGEAAKPEGEEDEEDLPIDMSFPTDSPARMIIYILSFPLMAPLYITLPDTKNNEYTIFPSLKIPGNSTIKSDYLYFWIIFQMYDAKS